MGITIVSLGADYKFFEVTINLFVLSANSLEVYLFFYDTLEPVGGVVGVNQYTLEPGVGACQGVEVKKKEL